MIDGTDGSGKATQAKLLARRLKLAGKKVKTIDFPGYYRNFFGKFIGECLAGEHGDFLKVDPYFASLAYAGDRLESAADIRKWLEEGFIVIADRYVSSNQIHQGGKIKDAAARKKFLAWLEKMEYGVLKIPKPDVIIYLDVPLEKTIALLGKSAAQDKKKYLAGHKDAHENSRAHLRDAKASALSLVKRQNNWIKIDCCRNGELMAKKEISDIVFLRLAQFI